MNIIWLFEPHHDSKIKPEISSQLVKISETVMHLRNPWVSDSVFMAKLYLAMTIIAFAYCYMGLYNSNINYNLPGAKIYLIMALCAPAAFTPFLTYRIILIKNLSNFYADRANRKIYYRRFNTTITYDWNNLRGGLFTRTEFGGSGFSTSYALAFGPTPIDGRRHQKDCLWIDSNEPSEPDVKYVAAAWEYIRIFMNHGPDKLPPPRVVDWWHIPLHTICLTPRQAWLHYVPWRTGEAGEMQGKQNWLLPFWAISFPYNIILAICWFYLCQTFKIRAGLPPSELAT